jgi:D-glycero-D-manno-heptose 1,7-bisphosphate phosphatase
MRDASRIVKNSREPILLGAARFVFLDRDGVLNRKLPENQYPTSREDLQLLPGAGEALAKLNGNGRTIILVTNQRGIGLGLMTEDDLTRLHDALRKDLQRYGARLDAIYHCPHDPSREQCLCRKPATGLFERAMRDFPDLCGENSLVIGDSLSDIQAGTRLGMRTIFIEGEPLNRKPGSEEAATLANAVARSLETAVQGLLLTSCE